MYVPHDTDCVCEGWYLEGCFDSEDRGIMVSIVGSTAHFYTVPTPNIITISIDLL